MAIGATAVPVFPFLGVVPVGGAVRTRHGHQHHRVHDLFFGFHLDRLGFFAFQSDGLAALAGPLVGVLLVLGTEHPGFEVFGHFEAVREADGGTVLHEVKIDRGQDIRVSSRFCKVNEPGLQSDIKGVCVFQVFFMIGRISNGVGVLAIPVFHGELNGVELPLDAVGQMMDIGIARFIGERFTRDTEPAYD